jgi:hypothetical protein
VHEVGAFLKEIGEYAPQWDCSAALASYSARMIWVRTIGHLLLLVTPPTIGLLLNWGDGFSSPFPNWLIWWFGLACTGISVYLFWNHTSGGEGFTKKQAGFHFQANNNPYSATIPIENTLKSRLPVTGTLLNFINPTEYEKALAEKLRYEFPPPMFMVVHDVKFTVKYSGGERQIDVAVFRSGEKDPFLVAEAKLYSRTIDILHVDAL